jgi:hypothetical protein
MGELQKEDDGTEIERRKEEEEGEYHEIGREDGAEEKEEIE